jgi:hypothetical protein
VVHGRTWHLRFDGPDAPPPVARRIDAISSRRELPLAEAAYSSAVPPKGVPGFRREEVEMIGHPASLRLFPWPTKPILLPSGLAAGTVPNYVGLLTNGCWSSQLRASRI